MEHEHSERIAEGGSEPLRLASRLLTSHYPYVEVGGELRIFLGDPPEDAPFEVPIPSGFEVLGGATSEQRRGRAVMEVVLDTELPTTQARDAYRDALHRAGWRDDPRPMERRGFLSGPSGFLMSLMRPRSRSPRRPVEGLRGLPTYFRRDDRHQKLIVLADERPDGPTDVRLIFLSGGGSRRPEQRDPEALFVLPSLTPPRKARSTEDHRDSGTLTPPFEARTPGGAFGGHGHEHNGAYSFVALEVDASLETVASHYTAQLIDAGWILSDAGHSGPQAWTIWTFTDARGEEWNGAFTVLQLPGTPHRHFLHLRADRVREQQDLR